MLNFDIVCRTCSLQGNLQSLFNEDLIINPAAMLNEIVNIKVIKGDKYPQNICIRCFNALKTAYLFKNQCQESYKKFEQCLSLSSEREIITDCKVELEEDEELMNSVFIKEENQSECSETNEDWFELYKEPSNSTEVKTYECDKCNTLFQNQKSYKRHLRRHEQLYVCFNNRPFNCENCAKSFKNKQQLQNHVKLEHAGVEKHPNEKIEQTFPTDKNTQKRKFICDYCGRGYSQSSKLTTHIRTHTGEKPLACNECDKKFHSHTLLSQHKRIHHSNEKPFKCEFCGKCFALPRWLKVHLMTHTNDKPYACDICNQKFRQTHHLSRHKFIHTGEKPFSCSVCNKKFTQNSNLRTHMRTHTGEKPYVCSVCGKGFHDSSSKKNHQKKHTLFEVNQNVSMSVLSVSNTEK